MKKFSQELHRPARKHYDRRHVYVSEANRIWSADLVDMGEFAEFNDDYRYILTVIDIGSRFAWARPLLDKTGETLQKALTSIFNEAKVTPKKLWTDAGTEFYNKNVAEFLKEKKVELYSTFSENKAVFIERFNRTLKGRMWRYFTEHQTRMWIDVLHDILDEYNNTKHRMINKTPAEARTAGLTTIAPEDLRPPTPKFNVGDRVRISRVKALFEKGYTPNWSVETFVITAVHRTIPVTYSIKDHTGEVLKGKFYEAELQKTTMDNDIKLIEKVLETRTVRGVKRHLVKWFGYPDTANSWIDDKDIVQRF